MTAPRGIAILGSTGSIGRSTLAVMALHPERFRVSMLGAYAVGRRWSSRRWRSSRTASVLVDPAAADQARAALRNLGSTIRVESGTDAPRPPK